MGTETVKDTINDVFLYLWEKRNALEHINNPHNYIITFFYRSIFKKLEHTDKAFDEINVDDDTEFEVFAEPSFEENLFDKESQQKLSFIVNRYLNYLPKQQREIMYQKFFLGLSYAEIARVNKISVNTVYNTVYAAMHKLRTSIPAKVVAALISACITFFIFFF